MRGDDFVIPFAITDDDWLPANLTDCQINLTVKDPKQLEIANDSVVIFKKTITSFVNPTAWTGEIVITNQDTKTAWFFEYDIQLKKADGSICTLVRQRMNIMQDVTRDPQQPL